MSHDTQLRLAAGLCVPSCAHAGNVLLWKLVTILLPIPGMRHSCNCYCPILSCCIHLFIIFSFMTLSLFCLLFPVCNRPFTSASSKWSAKQLSLGLHCNRQHCSNIESCFDAVHQLAGNVLQTACHFAGTLSEAVDGVAEKAVLRGVPALLPGTLRGRRLVWRQMAACRVPLPHLSMEALLLLTATILLLTPTLVPHSTVTKAFQ